MATGTTDGPHKEQPLPKSRNSVGPVTADKTKQPEKEPAKEQAKEPAKPQQPQQGQANQPQKREEKK